MQESLPACPCSTPHLLVCIELPRPQLCLLSLPLPAQGPLPRLCIPRLSLGLHRATILPPWPQQVHAPGQPRPGLHPACDMLSEQGSWHCGAPSTPGWAIWCCFRCGVWQCYGPCLMGWSTARPCPGLAHKARHTHRAPHPSDRAVEPGYRAVEYGLIADASGHWLAACGLPDRPPRCAACRGGSQGGTCHLQPTCTHTHDPSPLLWPPRNLLPVATACDDTLDPRCGQAVGKWEGVQHSGPNDTRQAWLVF